MLMLAVAFALLWLGLPFGEWVPMIAAFPLITAGFMEIYARRGIRKLPGVAPAGLLARLRLVAVRLLAVRLLAVQQRE